MNAAGRNSEQQAVNNQKSIASEQTKKSERDETLSFLNSLPEVNKPKPKRSIRDEHLDFLNSLPQVPVSKVQVVTSEQAEPELSRMEQEELQVQALREESIRLGQDAELAKLAEQQEAEDLKEQIAMKLNGSSDDQSAYLNSNSRAALADKASA